MPMEQKPDSNPFKLKNGENFKAVYKSEVTALDFYKPIVAFVKHAKYCQSQVLIIHRENVKDEPTVTSVFLVDMLPPIPQAEHFQGQVLLKFGRNEDKAPVMTAEARLVEYAAVEEDELGPDERRKGQNVLDKVAASGGIVDHVRTEFAK